jgi:hypothetical protein
MNRYVLTGQAQAKAKSGIVERPRSHFHPRVGITKSASSTSKQAPRAQKHYICGIVKKLILIFAWYT